MIDIYNINWRNVSDNLIPWFWRNVVNFVSTAKNALWLPEYAYSVMFSFQNLTNRLYVLAFNIDNNLKYSGLVAVLEICLNDYFDSLLRRIKINDVDIYNFEAYILSGSTDTYQTWLLTNKNTAPFDSYLTGSVTSDYDFFVEMPSGLSYEYNRLVQIVNRYRAGGKRFAVITV